MCVPARRSIPGLRGRMFGSFRGWFRHLGNESCLFKKKTTARTTLGTDDFAVTYLLSQFGMIFCRRSLTTVLFQPLAFFPKSCRVDASRRRERDGTVARTTRNDRSRTGRTRYQTRNSRVLLGGTEHGACWCMQNPCSACSVGCTKKTNS